MINRLFAMDIMPKLFDQIMIGSDIVMFSSLYRLQNQRTFIPEWVSAMYFASGVDRATIICFLDFHRTAPPADKKTSPIVDFLSSAFAKAVSVYPMSGLVGLYNFRYVMP